MTFVKHMLKFLGIKYDAYNGLSNGLVKSNEYEITKCF